MEGPLGIGVYMTLVGGGGWGWNSWTVLFSGTASISVVEGLGRAAPWLGELQGQLGPPEGCAADIPC